MMRASRFLLALLLVPSIAWAGITSTNTDPTPQGTITVTPVTNQTTVSGSPVGLGGTVTIGAAQCIGTPCSPTFQTATLSLLTGSGNRCVYADSLGILHAKGDDCGPATFTGDNLGNHIMTQNLRTMGYWLSRDGTNAGILLDASGNITGGVWQATSIATAYTDAKVVSVSCTTLTCSGTNPATFSIADGALGNAKLANASITVAAGSGVGLTIAGSPVSLGGTVTLGTTSDNLRVSTLALGAALISGAGLELQSGAFDLALTNPVMAISIPTFRVTGDANPLYTNGGIASTITLGSGFHGGTSIVGQTVIEAGNTALGTGGVYGGALTRVGAASDSYGVLGVIANGPAVGTPGGTAIYALIRGEKATGGTVDGIRVTSEVNAPEKPRIGVVVSSSSGAGNAFQRGVVVHTAGDYGFAVGGSTGGLAIPTYPFALLTGGDARLFSVDAAGLVFGSKVLAGDGTRYVLLEGRSDGADIGGMGGASLGRVGDLYQTNPIPGAATAYAAQGASGQRGAIGFATKNVDDDTTQPAYRMVITAPGNVGIGTTSPTNLLSVVKTETAPSGSSTAAFGETITLSGNRTGVGPYPVPASSAVVNAYIPVAYLNVIDNTTTTSTITNNDAKPLLGFVVDMTAGNVAVGSSNAITGSLRLNGAAPVAGRGSEHSGVLGVGVQETNFGADRASSRALYALNSLLIRNGSGEGWSFFAETNNTNVTNTKVHGFESYSSGTQLAGDAIRITKASGTAGWSNAVAVYPDVDNATPVFRVQNSGRMDIGSLDVSSDESTYPSMLQVGAFTADPKAILGKFNLRSTADNTDQSALRGQAVQVSGTNANIRAGEFQLVRASGTGTFSAIEAAVITLTDYSDASSANGLTLFNWKGAHGEYPTAKKAGTGVLVSGNAGWEYGFRYLDIANAELFSVDRFGVVRTAGDVRSSSGVSVGAGSVFTVTGVGNGQNYDIPCDAPGQFYHFRGGIIVSKGAGCTG